MAPARRRGVLHGLADASSLATARAAGVGQCLAAVLGLQRVTTPVLALLLACALAAAASLLGSTWWRRGLIAAGFPLALASTGGAVVPAWAWLVPLGLLALVYPLNAWRDAPCFRPRSMPCRLAAQITRWPGARAPDAGVAWAMGCVPCAAPTPKPGWKVWNGAGPCISCAPCAALAQVRGATCGAPTGAVTSSSTCSSARKAWPLCRCQAQAEMASGSWLVSLNLRCPVLPQAQLRLPGIVVWIYRFPRAQASRARQGAHG